jgi:hypothetical protein
MHLRLVAPHRFYRAAPDLSRPELRDAYEQGRAARGAELPDEALAERMSVMTASGREAMRAFRLGHGPDEALAPAPLALSLLLIAASAWLAAVLERSTGPGRRLLILIGPVLLTWPTGNVLLRVRKRRGRALGLSADTAPLQQVPGSLVMQLAIAAGYALSYRTRRGSWPRPMPATFAAGQLVEEFMSRRSWREVRERGLTPRRVA